MKIVVTSTGAELDAQASPIFGRCPTFLFVDTESLQFEVVPNSGVNAAGGAGIQAAQLVAGRDVQAVVSGKIGPKAMDVIKAAGLPVYLFNDGTVRQAVERFTAGELALASDSALPDDGRGKGNRRAEKPTCDQAAACRGGGST